MTCSKPTTRCDDRDVRAVRLVGDATRTRRHLCAGCRAILEAAPFTMSFLPADAPEWVLRARESRLPAWLR